MSINLYAYINRTSDRDPKASWICLNHALDRIYAGEHISEEIDFTDRSEYDMTNRTCTDCRKERGW